MTKKQNQCYFMGKCFDSLVDLCEYEAKWRNDPLDDENAKLLVSIIASDIAINAMCFAGPMTNGEFKEKLSDVFVYAIKLLIEEKE